MFKYTQRSGASGGRRLAGEVVSPPSRPLRNVLTRTYKGYEADRLLRAVHARH